MRGKLFHEQDGIRPVGVNTRLLRGDSRGTRGGRSGTDAMGGSVRKQSARKASQVCRLPTTPI